jgi:L-2-hydroxyglutarate oxidase LhgO
MVIVGGGIVGLATARELLLRRPGLRLLVLEKEAQIAQHQSGHNSGVIHTGIYYTPGSLKAKACVEGHRLMLEFCHERAIPFELCGKVIVALDESELPRLHELYQRGNTNGVAGLELIGPERLHELEPYAAGIKAIYSPNTGIIDYVKVAQAYAAEIKHLGGEILTGYEVLSLTNTDTKTIIGFRVVSTDKTGELHTTNLITCAGLQSDKLSRMSYSHSQAETLPENDIQIVPFRGDYYLLRPEKRHMTSALIYPVPDPRFPFLGVHFTRRLDGEVWAGPNAVLAFAREGYKRRDFKPLELWQSLSFRGFWKMAGKYWQMGLAEMYRDYSKAAYLKTLQRYMPELQAADLLPGPSGVRAQALARDGRLVDDFLIKRGSHYLHVQNAPSPAATSSLFIAKMIADAALD